MAPRLAAAAGVSGVGRLTRLPAATLSAIAHLRLERLWCGHRLRDFEDEMLPAADATELFDVLGWLGDVLADSPSADAWLGLA